MKALISFLFTFLIYLTTTACSCIGESSVEEEFKKSDLVVTGQAISVRTVKIWSDTSFAIWNYTPEKDTVSFEQYKFDEELNGIHLLEYTFVVRTSYKGAHVNDTLKIWTGFGRGDCGFRFILGQSYLVFAQDEYSQKYTEKKLGRTKKELRGIFRTDICRRTALLSESDADLTYLNKKRL